MFFYISSFIPLASNPETEICPLDGSYTLRGLITPPTSYSRHKRNHNSKQRNGNNNHHHSHDLSLVESSRIANNFKTHTSLSFRNEEDSLKSWHFSDRNKSLRQRRSLPVHDAIQQSTNDDSNEDEQSSESDSRQSSIAIIPAAEGAFNDVLDDGSDVTNIDDEKVIKLVRNKRNNSNNKRSLELGTEIVVSLGTKANANDSIRSRRDATINCGGNVNTMSRQLAIGCADETKIEVSPQCNEDGDEGKC